MLQHIILIKIWSQKMRREKIFERIYGEINYEIVSFLKNLLFHLN